jgi:hypothetical protein
MAPHPYGGIYGEIGGGAIRKFRPVGENILGPSVLTPFYARNEMPRSSDWNKRPLGKPITIPARVHRTLRVTPAMEAGLNDRVWTLAELVSLLERHSLAA